MQQATQQLYSWTGGVWIVILVFPAVPRIIHQSSHPQTRIRFQVCSEHLFLGVTVIQWDPINFSSFWEISLRSKLNFFAGGMTFGRVCTAFCLALLRRSKSVALSIKVIFHLTLILIFICQKTKKLSVYKFIFCSLNIFVRFQFSLNTTKHNVRHMLTKKTAFVKIKINEKIQKGRWKTKKARNTDVKKKYFFQKKLLLFFTNNC